MTHAESNQVLRELLQSMCGEIELHRWQQSERRGEEMSWEEAVVEWMALCFPEWKNTQWQVAVLASARITR